MNITLLDYNEIYDRLVSGKPYDINLKPYTDIQLTRALSIFEETEEYEKCKAIKEYLDKNNHNTGYKLTYS